MNSKCPCKYETKARDYKEKEDHNRDDHKKQNFALPTIPKIYLNKKTGNDEYRYKKEDYTYEHKPRREEFNYEHKPRREEFYNEQNAKQGRNNGQYRKKVEYHEEYNNDEEEQQETKPKEQPKEYHKKKNQKKPYEESHRAQALCLGCMDYRYADASFQYIQSGPLNNRFDFVTMPGASIGFNQRDYEHWKPTFIDQVRLAIELHAIEDVIVIDHLGCSAIAKFYPDVELDSEQEREIHKINIEKFIRRMKRIFPNLKYSGFLIHCDGDVETISRS